MRTSRAFRLYMPKMAVALTLAFVCFRVLADDPKLEHRKWVVDNDPFATMPQWGRRESRGLTLPIEFPSMRCLYEVSLSAV
jgi:hypothetical protein